MTHPLTKAIDIAEQRGDRALAAYFHEFDPTGVPQIDLILATIAAAGKAYHSTEMWDDHPYDDDTVSYWEMIQAAADEAATHLKGTP